MPRGLPCSRQLACARGHLDRSSVGLTIMDGIASGLSPAAACAIRICVQRNDDQPMCV